jgi:hypothetical protein
MLVGFVVVAALIVVLAALPIGSLGSALASKRDDVARKSELLLTARKHVADSQALAGAGRPQRSGDARAAVDKVFAAVGVQTSRGSGANDDGQASIVIGNASFDNVVRAIDTLARDEAIHLVDGTITRLVESGRVRADLVFAR